MSRQPLRKENKTALLLLVLVILFWSTVATAFKIGLRTLDPFQMIFIATGVSIVILAAYISFEKKWKLVFCSNKKQIIHSALLGLINPTIYYVILFKAYDLLPAQVAQPINLIWPIFLVVLSVPMLKQKIGTRTFIALFISFAGVLIISSQGNINVFAKSNPLGVALGIATAFIWAVYWLLNVKDERNELVKLFYSFCFGFLYLFILLPFVSNFSFGFGQGFLASVYIGFFELGFTFIFWMKALALSNNRGQLANYIYIFPVISLFFIHYILKEPIHATTIIGIIFIISGIIFQQTDKVSAK